MHYSVLVTVDGSVKEADIEEAVGKLMEPFNENTEVPEYAIDPAKHRYHDSWEDTLAKSKKWHATCMRESATDSGGYHWFNAKEDVSNRTDLGWLNWYSGDDADNGPWREDGQGGYAEWSTYNPLSKWDWWTIGGRWAEFLNQVPNGKEEHPVWGTYTVYKDGKNYLRRRDLRRPQVTYAYLTKDGVWEEKESPELDWSDRDAANALLEEAQKRWDKSFAEYLLTVPGEDWIVVVDIHI